MEKSKQSFVPNGTFSGIIDDCRKIWNLKVDYLLLQWV